jgi:predicted AAA+ superfamily ATPase
VDVLFEEFERYLVHGGYLKAINDHAHEGSIRAATLITYQEWVRGDVLKRGKQESDLREGSERS